MEAVDVLDGIHGIHHPVAIHPGRQRQLHQDAVDALIVIERVDEGENLPFAGAHRQVVREGLDPGLLRGAALVAHVHARGRIFPHLHHRESGAPSVARGELRRTRRDRGAHPSGDQLAVEQHRAAGGTRRGGGVPGGGGGFGCWSAHQ